MNINIIRKLIMTSLLLPLFFTGCRVAQEEFLTINCDVAVSRAFSGDHTQINSMTVTVSSSGAQYVSNQNLTNNAGVWSGSYSLPAGIPLQIFVEAKGDNGSGSQVALFAGVTTHTISGPGETAVVALSPVDDGSGFNFPGIRYISMPIPVEANKSYDIKFALSGLPFEVISYQLTPDPTGGSFTPATGQVTLDSNGEGAAIVSHTTGAGAVGVDKVYTNQLTVTGSSGNSTQIEFQVTISPSLAASVAINVAPYMTRLSAQRDAAGVTFTAVVEDENLPGVTSSWLYNDVQFASGSYTAVLTGYDETYNGVVKLVLTDDAGAVTTVSIPLTAGLFPDNPVVHREVDDITISFWVRAGGNAAETGEELRLQYLNMAGTWVDIRTYTTAQVSTGTVFSELLQPATHSDAYHTGFKVRWYQNTHSGQNMDNFAVDDILITQNATQLLADDFATGTIDAARWATSLGVVLTTSFSRVDSAAFLTDGANGTRRNLETVPLTP